MLEFALLGFLYEAPLHGYELRRQVAALMGHTKPIAEGTMYPAIKRLENHGWVIRHFQKGTSAAQRHGLTLTESGRDELLRRLREPEDLFITDENRWFCLLAFLRHLQDPAAQASVLRRRLDFLTTPASFFYDGDRPMRAEEFDDPFRQGMMTIARVTSRTELQWLRETIEALEEQGDHASMGH